MPFPFVNQQFLFHQPDGETINVIGSGNQYHAIFQTLDEYTIIQNVNGVWEYAKISPDGEELVPSGIRVGSIDPAIAGLPKNLRMSPRASKAYAKKNKKANECEWMKRNRAIKVSKKSLGTIPAPPSTPTTGTVLGLCLLIDFPDVGFTINRQEVDAFCNRTGYNGYGNNGSVRDYFHDNSNGRLNFTNTVVDWFTAQNPRSYYTDPRISYGVRAQELIKEALRHLQSSGFIFDNLTRDARGNVKALSVFYAGDVVNDWAQGLWPHASTLTVPFIPKPGIQLRDYQITNMGSELSLGTFCHENAHMVCDFPDLYDYGYESSGVGIFCLMCVSSYRPKNPQNVCAYLRHKAGWIDATDLTSGIHQVGPGQSFIFSRPNRPTEYFIIEVRVRQGRDSALPGTGLAVWHVDELGDQNHEQMTPSKHYECSLEQADGKFDLERRRRYLGEAVDLFQTGQSFTSRTTPGSLWWDGTPSGLNINSITQLNATTFEIDVA